MRRTAVEMAALAALLLGGALAYGQQADPREAPPPAVVAPAAAADKPKDAPPKSKLEEMLQKALQDNPDLRLAAAKVAEAEAELNRARLLVVQKVGAAYQAIEAQKAAVEGAAAELNELKNIAKSGAGSSADMRAAEQKLIDAKAKLATLEAEMPYLLGKQPEGKIDAQIRLWLDSKGASPAEPSDAVLLRRYYLDLLGRLPTKEEQAAGVGGLKGALGGGMGATGGGFGALGGGMGALGGGFGALGGGLGQLGGGGGVGGGVLGGGPFNPEDEAPKPVPVLGKTAERIRAALDKPFSLDLKKAKLSTVIAEVSAAFQKANPGLLIKCNFPPDQLGEELENVRFDEMPFGAVLVWIEDSVGNGAVVVRDYGLVIAPMGELPPGAPTLHDFWKGAKGEEKAPAKDQSVNSPSAPSISGLVDNVASTGLVQLNLGSDIGIVKGNILEVIRLDKDTTLPWSKHKYLGRVRVVAVSAKESVAEPVDKMPEPLKTGDWVTTTRIYSD
jgi:hypothetical protein